jgi:hypothetical protein
MVGNCGHTLCIGCKEKLKGSTCPFCQKKVVFKPNFMLRDILEHGRYAPEYKIRERAYFDTTPQGVIESYKKIYPNCVLKSTLHIEDQSWLMTEAHRFLVHRKTTGTFKNFDWKFATQSINICRDSDFFSISQNPNYFQLFYDGYFCYICLSTKRLQWK